ncbi:MAG: restriction endonuclease, partial [Methylobacterium sp.]|nr:restriction endonuclease [Methylobacterium sp.]
GNRLYYGDNLEILRQHIADASVDLIYLDPPFNSNATYNVLFKAPGGEQSQSQIEAFDDTWHWGERAEKAFDEVMTSGNTDAAEMLRAMRGFLKENDMMAYLAMMAVRLIELHRVLKPTGSLYLHCDPTASHYLKILLDAVFGKERFRSEIIWKRSSAHNDAKQGRKLHGHIHDCILFYTKGSDWKWNHVFTPYSEEYTGRDYGLQDSDGRRFRRGDLTAAKPGGDTAYEWRVKRPAGSAERWVGDIDDEYKTPRDGWEYKSVTPYSGRYWAYSRENMKQFEREGRIRHTYEGMPEYKRYLDEMPGVPLQDVWTDVLPIIASTQERLGYPTQKPLALLERILAASSNEGDVVLDPFCGCGTTVHAAEKMGRQWIGIDITHLAIGLIKKRLVEAFPLVQFEVLGVPKDVGAAEALAEADKHQFQLWACSMVEAVPFKGGRKGADGGVDGYIYFKPDGKTSEKAVVSVKGGKNVGVGMVRDLIATIERERAKVGIILTLAEPTREMKKEAATAGLYKTEMLGDFPRIQILTMQDLFDGDRPRLPWIDPTVFKKAKREKTEKQGDLF